LTLGRNGLNEPQDNSKSQWLLQQSLKLSKPKTNKNPNKNPSFLPSLLLKNLQFPTWHNHSA
jgi:hypothetical protein